jgi:CubicO group peptidase (beta-lactamase class C family)
MKQPIYRLVISILFLTPMISQSQTPLPDSVILRLREAVKGFKDRYHSPSIVVAIVHENKIVFSEAQGYVDIENKIPASINSKYPIMSVTKTFTATMLMQLMQKNLVELHDDVKKYVPEFRGDTDLPGKSGITLFQLATHTSGLPRNTPADIKFTKQIDKWILVGSSDSVLLPASKKEFLQSLQFIRKEYPEYELMSYGDRHYSNLGYSLLGIALERAAKTDFADYILYNICKPLNMNSTGFDTKSLENNLIAKGYYYDEGKKEFLRTPAFKSNSALYAGGMFSTATDLAKYVSFQLQSSVESNKILSEENRAMMWAFKIGWKPSYPLVFHEGHILGYRSIVTFNSELKFGWVVLTNTNDFEFSRLNEYFNQLLSPVFNKKPLPGLQQYTGIYQLEGGYDRMEIYLRNDSLYSTYLKEIIPEVPLTSTGRNRFKAQGKGNYTVGYEFIQDEKGEIRMLNLGQLKWIKK